MKKIFLSTVLIALALLLPAVMTAQYCSTATTNVTITPTTTAQLTSNYNSGIRAFNFAAVAGNVYTFETCNNSTADTYLRLYSTGTGGSVLSQSDDACGSQSRIVWTCPANGTYSILLTNWSCANLSANTRVNYFFTAPPPAPANDLAANATTITCGQTLSGTTVNATTTGTYEGTTACGVSQSTPAVWYRITGTGVTMTASLCGTSWDSKMSVYSGASATSLTCLGGNDDNGPACSGTSASYQWASVAGTTYWIKVYGFSVNSAFNITVNCASACNPPSGLTVSSLGPNTATVLWTAASPAPANGYDVYLATNTIAPTASTTPLGTVTSTGVNLTGLTQSTTYYIWVRSRCGLASSSAWVGPISFTTTSTNPCASIGTISCGTAASYSLAAGSGAWDMSNLAFGPWATPGNEQIFTFTPTVSGQHTIALTNNEYYTDLYYRTGGCGTTGWSYVGDVSSAGTSYTLTLTAGTTYYLLMDDENTTASAGTITITCPVPYNPCGTNIINIAGCGVTTPVNIASGSGVWDNFGGPYSTPGKEVIYRFTPAVTANYPVTVTNNGSGWIDLFYKIQGGPCTSTGWTYVDDVAGTATNNISLIAGNTYQFLLDDEDANGSTGSILIGCPCIGPANGIDFSFTAPFTHSSTTSGACNDCSFSSSEDRTYAINITCPGDYTFSLCGGATWDTYMYLSSGPCSGFIASNDDACSLQSQITAPNLAAGTYYITIEGFSNTSAGSYTLSVSGTGSAPAINASANMVSCNGGSNGSISASISGFAPVTSVTFDGNPGLGPWNNLSAGSYVIAATNCWGTSTQTVVITEPSALSASSSSGSILCNGGSTTVTVSANGGTAPYSGTGTYTVTAGTYTYTVTDANGCSTQTTITVTEPYVLTVSASAFSYNCGYNVSCNGGADGQAVAVAGGGTSGAVSGGYTYTWSNSATGANATGLAAGTYTVVVTDLNGCTASAVVTLTEPDAVVATVSSPVYNCGYNISCSGATDGQASASVTGGCAPYSYNWSNGNTSSTATGLSATTYSVSITDANGCVTSASIALSAPAPLTIDGGNDVTVYFGYGPASCATLTPTSFGGGCAPYTITWSGGTPSGNSTTVCPQTSTTYTVTIVDANGCVATDEVNVCVVNVVCYAGSSSNQKVEICHNGTTICISPSAVPSHLAHGCTLGSCGSSSTSCGNPVIRINNEDETPSADHTIGLSAYPNPFGQTTTVQIEGVQTNHAVVNIYNMTGQLISTVYAGEMSEDSVYRFDFTPEAESGVYFVTVTTEEGQMQTIRVVNTR